MKAIMLAMVLEASRLTGLPVAEPPKVTYLTHEAMARSSGDERTLGIYVCLFRRMYLRDDFDVERIRDQAVLLHELVHHLQCKEWGTLVIAFRRCRAETGAYRAQAQWLGRRGRDFYGVNRFSRDGFARYMAKVCP